MNNNNVTKGLDSVICSRSKVLILGEFPGQASLEQNQYRVDPADTA